MPSVFQAEISYCLTTYNAQPPTQCDWQSTSKKKRSSGLQLLRPKSSYGGGRNAILSPEPSVKPLSSYPIPPPPPPPQEYDHDDITWKKDRYDTQRATLRHTRSIPQLPPLTPPRDSPQKLIPSNSSMVNRWRKGVIVIHVHGDGGAQGGGLTIYDNDEIILRQIIRPVPELTWGNDDIQKIHPSVYDRPFVLSIHLPGSDSYKNNLRKSTSKARPLKPQMSTLSKIGRRARGYTITKVDTSTGSSSSGITGDHSIGFEEDEERFTSDTSISTSNHDQSSDQILLLDFKSEKEKNEWFTLLRSFGGSYLPRVHRRLQIRVLDLQESIPLSNLSIGHTMTKEEGLSNTASSFDQISARSSEPQNPSSSKLSRGEGGKHEWKSGWAGKDRLKVEIYTDKHLMGQTTWVQAEDRSEIPFWAELFTFENVRDFTTCTLKISRMRSGKHSQPFATVHLPLVSSFMKAKDERFPIISLSGHVIGELRLIANFTIVNVVGMEVYPLPEVFHGMGGTRTIYYMMSKGLLDHCVDMFTRFNWALGTTFDRLVEMSEIEAKASGDTLFRGNSPMTRLLEATMRLVCFDFLKSSIGPTVNVVLENEIEANNENTRSVVKILDDCWEDMYTQRGTFPNILRQVFAILFKNVKENHEERKLRYKAVSSFLFLRLIGPALMRPHLFGLARGLPRVPVQKTLTLIAKIFHTMAFFTWSDSARDPELARYSSFIRKNNDTMIDYLSSFATPLDDFQCRPTPPSTISIFLSQRLPLLPPEIAQGVPMLTVAGPVEVDADAAVFYELLFQRRKARVGGAEMTREDGVVPGEEEEMHHLLRTMDQFVSSVHRASYEHVTGDNGSSIHSDPRDQSITSKSKESLRPIIPSCPSLQIDIGSAQRDRKLELSRTRSNLSPAPAPETLDLSTSRRVKSPNPSSMTSSTHTSQSHSAHGGGGVMKWLNFGWMSPTFRPPGLGYEVDQVHNARYQHGEYGEGSGGQSNSLSGRLGNRKDGEVD
ncbi:hypothetical protein I302_107575 [Kwoniella bestiolae CBS 10118]|uniref:Ras-GAP domain-containing protein n=1 Tax=Kwoniella bestiolae CBS 10118 TaxID=1296100 RepID=A0A1B9FY60_9TREE|nr:hypothetical protein I302_06685 [Kwoniella bestiolae CBS 10118]OCF23702.1 hypothetical protein I302_06685 [Kwoniella bestiolae CBS 10118]